MIVKELLAAPDQDEVLKCCLYLLPFQKLSTIIFDSEFLKAKSD